jgi:hypothetical protein
VNVMVTLNQKGFYGDFMVILMVICHRFPIGYPSNRMSMGFNGDFMDTQ